MSPWTFALAIGGVLAVALAAVGLRPGWVVRWPRSVLAALLLVSALAAGGLVRLEPLGLTLEVDPSTEPLLPAGDPGQEVYRRAVLDFGDDEVYVVVVECEEVFTHECLSSLERISDPIARMSAVRSVSSLADVTSFRWVPEDGWIEVRPLLDEIPRDPEVLARLRERALSDPVYRRVIVSEDSRNAAVNIVFQEMSDNELIAGDFDARIQALVEAGATAGSKTFVSGRPRFKTTVYHGMLRDLGLLIPLALLVMTLVLWAVNGTLRGVVLPLGVAFLGNLWTFAAMAFVARPLTLLTGLLGPTLLALGSVYGVHMLARYQEEVARGGTPEQVVRRLLAHMVVPVVVAGLTTVIGFAALLITDVPAVFELGTFSMLGVASLTLLTLTLIPAVLRLLPVRSARGDSVAAVRTRLAPAIDRWLAARLASLAARVERRSGAVLIASGLVCGLAAAMLPRIVIDTDYLSYFDERDPVRTDFEAVNERMAGAIPLYVVIDGEGPGAFREPALLREIQRLQERLDEVDGVSRTLSFIDSLRMLNRAFHADDPGQETIPETRPAVAELLFMLPKSDAQRFTTVNHGRANLVVRTGLVGSNEILRLTRDIEAVLADQPLPGASAQVTGNAVLLARSADGIARGQPLSVAVAAVTIFFLIALALRSPRIGALAMVPNLLPVLAFFGLLGLGVAPLSLPTSLIGCLALGIAIDDTVHYLVRYRDEREAGLSPGEAARQCTLHVGRPIAVTSFMLVAGFLVVTGSKFATLQEFGYLSAGTMGICLLNDLVLLPALLSRARA